MLFINILDSLTAPCLVYNTAVYTVFGRCSLQNLLSLWATVIRNAIISVGNP